MVQPGPRLVNRRRGAVRLLKQVEPLVPRPGREQLRQLAGDPGQVPPEPQVSRVSADARVVEDPSGAGGGQPALDEGVGEGAEKQPLAVAAAVGAVVGQRPAGASGPVDVRLVAARGEVAWRDQLGAVRAARYRQRGQGEAALAADQQRDRHERGPDALHVQGQREQAVNRHVGVGRLVPGMTEPGEQQARRFPAARPWRLLQQVGRHHHPEARLAGTPAAIEEAAVADAGPAGADEQHVRAGDQLVERRQVAGVRRVRGDGALAAVPHRRSALARMRILSRRVHLDHVGAQVGEQHPGDGTGHAAGEVEARARRTALPVSATQPPVMWH